MNVDIPEFCECSVTFARYLVVFLVIEHSHTGKATDVTLGTAFLGIYDCKKPIRRVSVLKEHAFTEICPTG